MKKKVQITLVILMALFCQSRFYSITAQTILFEEKFQNKTVSDLTDWHFDDIASVSITDESLKVGLGWIYTPLISSPDNGAFNESYEDIVVEISYTYFSPGGWAPAFMGYLENNSGYPQQIATDKIFEDNTPTNRPSTIIYRLNDQQMGYSQLCVKFMLGWYNVPELYIHSIKVSGVKIGSEYTLQANFEAKHNYLSVDETLKLFDTSTGIPTSWEWQVNHSTNTEVVLSADVKEPEFILTEEGAYDISLTVWENGESSTITKSSYVYVGCKAVATTTEEGHISDVVISQGGVSLHSPSVASTYTFFDLSAEAQALNSNDKITVSVTASELGAGFSGGAFVRLWPSEYKRNDLFNPDEYIDIPLTINGNTATGEATFKPHVTANEGKFVLRLKLSADESELVDPCENLTIGEVEDYLLLVRNSQISSCQGNTLTFSEPGSHILIGDKQTPGSAIYKSPVNSFCIETWIKKFDYLDGICLFEQGNESSTTISLVVYINEAHLTIDNQLYIIPITQVKPKSWFNFALVGTGEEVSLYVNSSLVKSLPVAGAYFTNATNDTYTTLLDDNFTGRIDETRFWATSRTPEQMINNSFFALPSTDRDQLLAYYQYNYYTLNTDKVIHDWHGMNHAKVIGNTSNFSRSFLPFLFRPAVEDANGHYSIFEGENWSWDISELPHSKSMVVLAPDQYFSIDTKGLKPQISSLFLSPGSNVSIDEQSYIDIKDSIVYVGTTDKPAAILGLNRVVSPDGLPMYVDYTFEESRNWYMGPLADANIIGDIPGQMYDGTNIDTWDFYIYDWHVKNGWQLITDPLTPLLPVKGYLFHPRTKGAVKVEGRITNQDTYSVAINQKGYHLVSNPFWAYLSLNELINGEHAGSSSFKEGIFDTSVTLWTSINSERVYAHYNGIINESVPGNFLTDGLVAPMQGFFILHHTEDNAELQINRSMLTVPQGTNPSLKSAQKDNIIRIKIDNQQAWYETAIAFHKDGSTIKTGGDTELRKVRDTKVPFVFTHKKDENDTPYELAINLQPEEFESLSIPLGFYISPEAIGEQVLTISGLNNDKDLTAFLVTPEGDRIKVENEQEVFLTFNEHGSYNDYTLVLDKGLSTNLSNPDDDSKWQVYNDGDKIKVTSNEFVSPCKIEIINASGIQLVNQQMHGSYFEYRVPSSACYIVIIDNDGIIETFKCSVTK